MPGDSVTLWILCEHGEANQHGGYVFEGGANDFCPGGRPPTDEELIVELERRGMLRQVAKAYIGGRGRSPEEPPKDPWDYDP